MPKKKKKNPTVKTHMAEELINMVWQIIETNGNYAIEQNKFINAQLQAESTHLNDGSGSLAEDDIVGFITQTNIINTPEKIREAMEHNKESASINIQKILGIYEKPKADA